MSRKKYQQENEKDKILFKISKNSKKSTVSIALTTRWDGIKKSEQHVNGLLFQLHLATHIQNSYVQRFQEYVHYSGCPIPRSCKNQDYSSSARTRNIKWTEQWSANDFKKCKENCRAMPYASDIFSYATCAPIPWISMVWHDKHQTDDEVNRCLIAGFCGQSGLSVAQLFNRQAHWPVTVHAKPIFNRKTCVLLICTNSEPRHWTLRSHATFVVLTMRHLQLHSAKVKVVIWLKDMETKTLQKWNFHNLNDNAGGPRYRHAIECTCFQC